MLLLALAEILPGILVVVFARLLVAIHATKFVVGFAIVLATVVPVLETTTTSTGYYDGS